MKVSIITVVYNNRHCIDSCITSVLKQSYKNIEYLVIDGGSTDGTQEKIAPYKKYIDYYLSEKDSGLYNALNKGILKATGDIVGILNSDDLFYDDRVIENIVAGFKSSNADLIYGKGIFVDQDDISQVKRIYPSNPFKKNYLKFGWIPLHPTIYVRRRIFEEYGLYNENYKIASDYEISLRWFKNDSIKKHFLDKWMVKMRLGGKSTTMKLQKTKSKEDMEIIEKNNLMGALTLCFKIGRKIPHYLIPQIKGFKPSN